MPPEYGLIRQAAAIPVQGERVCLITSRSGKRWVIPKGCLEPGKSAGEMALQEAWEEAGLGGLLEGDPVGSYLYTKGGFTHHVLVFIMRVTQVSETWPERAFRQRWWLSPEQAVLNIDERGLREVMRGALLDRREPTPPSHQPEARA